MKKSAFLPACFAAAAVFGAPPGYGGSDYRFEPPVRVLADGAAVRVERPGYACPCWADIDGDGDKDLLVGQFQGGKIRVYKSDDQGALAAGEWLQASGQVAEIPGVW